MLARSISSVAAAEVYDVAIVGAGMVGAAVAALLRSNPLTAGMRLAIIDQQPPPMDLDMPQYPDLRVSTITPANMQLLQQTGAWHELQQLQAAPTFQHMQVWEYGGPGFISWQASDIGQSHMGCVIENRLLQASLLRAAQAGIGNYSSFGSTSNVSSGSDSSSGCLDFICPGSVQALVLPAASGKPTLSDASSSRRDSSSRSSSGSNSAASSSSSSSALAQLELQDGRKLHSRLVVAADGARSRIRDMAGFRTMGWQYDQRGLVATVATDLPNDTAWQRFLPTGPMALLPVRSGYSNIVWSCTPEMAKRFESYSSKQFADAVNDVLQQDPSTFRSSSSRTAPAGPYSSSSLHGTGANPSVASGIAPLDAAVNAASSVLQQLSSTVGGPVLQQLLQNPGGSMGAAVGTGSGTWRRPPVVEGWVGSPPKSFLLQLRHSGRYVGPRVVLVGDAAHAVHPLAGQGVNLGLGDAAALANALATARELGQDIGDVTMLQQEYEAPRQRANTTMIAALEVLWRGFGVQMGLAGAVRSAGLGLLNSVGPVKNQIMKYAMGYA